MKSKRILPLIALSVALIVLGISVNPFFKQKGLLNKSQPYLVTLLDGSNQSGSDTQQLPSGSNVLGWGYNQPEIYISDQNNYGNGGVINLSSTGEPSVKITSYNYSGQAEVSLYKADEDGLIDYLTHNKDGKQIKWNNPDISRFQFITKLNYQVQSPNSTSGLILPLDDVGIWLLRIKAGSFNADAFVLRSNIGAVAKEGNNEFIFWGQNYQTKRSVVDGSIRVYNLLGSRQVIGSTSFDIHGIAQLPISPDADIAIVEQSGSKALIPLNLKYLNTSWGGSWTTFDQKNVPTKYFLFTDRPIYKPGDTIYFKAILRSDDDVRYSVPAGNAKVAIGKQWVDATGKNAIFEKIYSVSADGTINGEYKLPEDAPADYYTLRVDLLPASNDYWNSGSTTSFQVQYYRKPEYSIEVNVPKIEYISGEQTSFRINGNYFSGQPLINQKVKYTITSGEFPEYTYYSSDMSPYISDDYRYWWWYGGDTVATGEATLDENGSAEVNLSTKITGGKSKVFAIEAELDDGSGNPSFARKNILVYSGEYGIYKTNWEYGGLINKPITLQTQLVSRGNTTVGNLSLEAKIHRETWISYQDPNQKYPSYRKEEEDLPAINATSDNNGKANFSFTPQKVGSYRLTVQGKDGRDNLVSKEFYFWVDDQDNLTYWGNYDRGSVLTVKSDKDQYKPQDTFKLSISSSIPDRDVLLTFERGRVNRFQVVRINGKKTTVDVPVESTDMPNIFADVSSFADMNFDRDEIDLPVSAETKRLSVNISPDKKTLGPGDSLTLNILTTDNLGNPVSADVAVWMVDKAIYELAESNLGKVFDNFWQERGNMTNTAHSLEGIIVETAEGGGCFVDGTKVLMGDGTTKNIAELKPGDTILTRKSESDSTLVSTQVKAVREADENGYLVINGSLKVTPDHYLWVNNSWKEAGSVQIGDYLVNSQGEKIIVYSIEWLMHNVKVYNLEIEKYKTFFADGIWVHNQKGGGGGRSVFKDTAYWNPSVHTDTNGKAQVVVKLPDNLTTWVVSAVGSTVDTKVGQIKDEVVVTKNVIVRPVIPNIVRIDDKIILSALVQNFTDNERTFTVSLKSDSSEIKPGGSQELTLKSRETKSAYWEVKPQKEDQGAKFVFSATAKDDSSLNDTITSVIPIIKFGFWDNRAQVGDGPKSYSINLYPDSDKDKSQVILSFSPTLIGTLPSAMKYLIWYPYGCVEQTTSRFVPAVIAKSNPGLFNEPLSGVNLDDVLKQGVKRLTDLQNWDGGWQWWSHGRSSPFVTSYVVEYLLRAKKIGVSVNDDVLQRAQGYLEGPTYWDPATQKDIGYSRDDQVAKIYGLSLLGSEKGKVLLQDFSNITPDILAMAIMVNVRNGNTNSATNGLAELERLAKTQDDGVFWLAGKSENFGSIDTSTGMAIRAIVATGGDKDLVTKAARFITQSRKAEYWSNTFATSQIIRGLVDYSTNIEGTNPNYSYQVLLDGKQITSGKVNNLKQNIPDITISAKDLKTDGSTIAVTKDGDGQIYSVLSSKEFRTDEKAKAVNNGLSIKKEYISEKGPGYSLAVGDLVTVRITVNGLKVDNNYGVITDELPAGMVPVNLALQNEQYNGDTSWYYDSYGVTDYEITQNGAVLSVYRIGAGEKTYEYKARVISEGTFIVPPVSVALMYTPEIYGRSEPQTITTTGKSVVPIDQQAKKVINNLFSNKFDIPILISGLVVIIGGLIILRKIKRKSAKKEEPKEEDQTQNIYP